MNLNFLIGSLLMCFTLTSLAAPYNISGSCSQETIFLAKRIFKEEAKNKTINDVVFTDKLGDTKLNKPVPSITIEQNGSVAELIVVSSDKIGILGDRYCRVEAFYMVVKDRSGNIGTIKKLN